MPRNRYTRHIHKEEDTRLAWQEKELMHIAGTLRCRYTEIPVLAPDDESNESRGSRLGRRQQDRAGQAPGRHHLA